ncbi:MAG: hypothetical protein ACYDBJ_25850 [Aggregatilineales bacterium]
MPIDEPFIAEVAAHIVALEKSTPDHIWTRYDRRQAAQAYIEQQMKAGRDVARTHWSLESNEYDQMLEQIAELGYRALLSQIRLESEQRKAQSGQTASSRVLSDSSAIPPQVYDAYHLAYNNVTYLEMRAALEETAEISQRSDGPGRLADGLPLPPLHLAMPGARQANHCLFLTQTCAPSRAG